MELTKKPKILVIEDTKSIREEIQDVLRFEGMEVITAENGLEGINLAKECLPDLILCDIRMPIKNGYEVFDEIQHDSNLTNTPFIFLTSNSSTDDIRHGMILGADDYITKPFSIDKLVVSVKIRLTKDEKRKIAERLKRKMLQNNISNAIPHEMLTPLNGIIGLSSIMKESLSELSSAEIQEFSEAIFESGNRLLDTVQKFIYHTEVELLLNDELKKQLSSNKIITYGMLILANQCDSVAKNYNRTLDLELEPTSFNAKISLNHFELIMLNIVDNAFKFSKKGDQVKVKVSIDNRFVHITVIDKGTGIGNIGIQDAEAFLQFNHSEMEQQGLGLGLSTTIKLIELYNGKINWTSNSDRGTSVKISLLLAS